MRKRINACMILVLAAVLAVVLGIFCGCADNDDSGHSSDHECSQICPVCGYCLDFDCYEDACWDKCGDELLYDAGFEAVNLKVAKSNVTTTTDLGCATDFNKSNNSSIVFKVQASEAERITLTVTVGKTSSPDVYTEVTKVLVNGEKIERPSVIPVYDDQVDSDRFVEVCLGCVDVVKGDNVFAFIAEGDGVNSHDFKKLTIIGNARYTLLQGEQLGHDCTNVCPDCGGCKDFTCYNSGCATKCTCGGGAPATVFWVCDERVDTSRPVNKELDGIGCTWNQTTRVVYTIDSDTAGEVTFGAVVSRDSKAVKFTDQFDVWANGVKLTGEGIIPVSSSGGREWNEYDIVVVGKIKLIIGVNEIVVEQTPRHDKTDAAYNLQSIVLFGNGNYDWHKEIVHEMTEHPANAATCTEDGNILYYTCSCHNKIWADDKGNLELTEEQTVVKASGHRYSETLVVTGAKTEYEPGETFDTTGMTVILDCTECTEGDVTLTSGQYTVSKTDALSASDASIIISYTDGDKTYSYTLAITVEHSHTLGECVPANEPTCTEDGNPAYYECSVCHKYFADQEATTELTDIILEALGHSLGAQVAAKAATCSATGNVAYYECGVCHKYFADAEAADEIENTVIEINPDGHKTARINRTENFCVYCNKSISYEFYFDHIVSNRVPSVKNGVLEGMGSTYDVETRFTYNIMASEAGEVTLYAYISRSLKEWKFTDAYKTYINGSTEPFEGTGMLNKYSSNAWTTYDLVEIGKVQFNQGFNSITFSFTPNRTDNAAYNFLKLLIEGEGKYDWAVCEFCGGCLIPGCTHESCGKAASCECAEKVIFNGMDEKVLFEGTGANKDVDGQNLPNNSKEVHTTKFYIRSDKNTTVKLYVRCSAIATQWQVAFSGSWSTSLNGTDITAATSSSIHHNQYSGSTDGQNNGWVICGATTKWDYYLFEYVCEIELREGVNEITFISIAGNDALNMRDIGFIVSDGATLTLASVDEYVSPQIEQITE